VLEGDTTTVRASVDVALESRAAFDALVQELVDALGRLGMRLDRGASGRVAEGEVEVGRVLSWRPGERIGLEWRQADWEPGEVTEVELRFEPVEDGTRVTVEHRAWGRLLGDRGGELVGWFAGAVVAPLLRATAPTGFGDWLTDRGARRPSGEQARALYRDPVYHRPNFRAMLQALALTADDYLVEVGCGGGAFLQETLASGCRAAAVDHSAEMVRLARELNRDAVAERRLEVLEASADRLPFPDATFTRAAMTGVLGFLHDPVAALAEIRRVLADGGRLVLFTDSPAVRGSLAAPEPFARRLSFYEEEELERLAREAGLADVRVERPDLEPFAREAGVPEEHLSLFAGRGGQLLLARKG
jgi:SAM-dependent methyltransferase